MPQRDTQARSEAAVRAVLLAGLSAIAAGAHEVAWSRLLGRAAGNTTVGVGLTLAAFMVGSGIGAVLVPKTRLWHRPRVSYAAAELMIGAGGLLLMAYCLRFPPPSALGLGLAADISIAGLISCVPAIAMGATYPLLVEASATRDVRTVRPLYAAGLVGVVLGTVGGAVFVAPVVGLDVLAAFAAAANFALAALALKWLPLQRQQGSALTDIRPSSEDRDAIMRFAAAGVFGLAAQTIWNRTLAPYAGVSTFTFAAIVAVYVLAQALGFAAHDRRWKDTNSRAGDAALAIAPLMAILSLALLSRTSDLPSRDGTPVEWFGAVALIVIAVVGPTAFALGVSQAAALHAVESRDDGWGRRAGMVAGIGTIASAAGALFASLIGISSLGPRWTLVAASVPAILAFARRADGRGLALGAAAAAAAAAFAAPGPRWFLGPAFDEAPMYFAEFGVQDTTAVVSVDRPVEPRIRRLVANGVSYSGDSIYAQRYMRLLAHLPAMVATGEERALLICIGTGTTLDALRAYGYDRIDAVDISPSVNDTLEFFSHVNHDVADDRRVETIIDDGARFLRRTDRTYDVITLEPPPPRAPGASSLYSIEFYEAARARLSPGGAIAQWLPLHGMSGAELETLVRTFAQVFDDATLHLSERNEAVLLGGVGNAPRVQAADPARWVRARGRQDVGAVGLDDRDPVADTFVMGGRDLLDLVGTGPVVRDMWPMPEYAPLAGADESRLAADEFVERVSAASHASPGSFASMLLPAVPGFLRLERQRGDAPDRVAVSRGMSAWFQRDPSNLYVQHAFGFGVLLEARLERLVAAGELDQAEAARFRQLIARQRSAVAP